MASTTAARVASGFFTDTTLCIGCKACEVACKQWNQLPADGYEFSGNSYDNTRELGGTTWRHVAFVEQAAPLDAPAGGYEVADDERRVQALHQRGLYGSVSRPARSSATSSKTSSFSPTSATAAATACRRARSASSI